MISLDLHGKPVPQTAPRVVTKDNQTWAYDKRSKEKEYASWQLKSQYREEPLESPVSLDLTFYMPIPESTSGIRKRQMLNGVIHHMKKPDIDNLQKFVLDCLKRIVIRDDAQIVEIRARKVYSSNPSTLIRIRPFNEQSMDDSDEDNRRKRQQ